VPSIRQRLRSLRPQSLASGPAGPLLVLATLALSALGHSVYVGLLEPVGLGGAYDWVTGLGVVYALLTVGLTGLVALGPPQTEPTESRADSLSFAGGLAVAVLTVVGHALVWQYAGDLLAVSTTYTFVPVAFAVAGGLAPDLRSRTLVVAGFGAWTLAWFAWVPISATVIVLLFAGAGAVAGLPVYLCARWLRTD
jgi:hypothetical protein